MTMVTMMPIATTTTIMTMIIDDNNDNKHNDDNINDNNCRRMDELAAQGGLNSRYGQHP